LTVPLNASGALFACLSTWLRPKPPMEIFGAKRLSSSITIGAGNNTNASRAKTAGPIMSQKSRVVGERRVKKM